MLNWLYRKLNWLYCKLQGYSPLSEPLNHDKPIEHGILYDWWRHISYRAFEFRTPATRKIDDAIRKFSNTIVIPNTHPVEENTPPVEELKDKINLWKKLRQGKSQRYSAVEQLEDQLNKRIETKYIDNLQPSYCSHFFRENKTPVEELQARVKKSVESTRRFTASGYGALGFLLQFLDFDYSFLLESLSFVC